MATKRKSKRTPAKPKATVTPEKTAAKSTTNAEVKITLDSFRRTSGIRPEHFSGFAHYITLRCESDASLWNTVSGWKNAYDEYLSQPVIG
jgi:phage tail tape-measure protein